MKNLHIKLFVVLFIVSSCYSNDDDDSGFGGFYNSPEDGNDLSGEQYNEYSENPFIKASDEPTSTFSVDADGGSYSNVRRMLKDNQKPPTGAVRVEEMINYFQYDYPDPTSGHPISITTEVAQCPWKTDHKLFQIGIKGETIVKTDLPPSNLVFLIDVSGSMSRDDKLPLVKHGFKKLVDELRDIDKVAIVTYAGSDQIALQSTPGDQKTTIINAIENLKSGGGTAGAKGIASAYEIAENNFIQGGNNRVILATDGDFNIGISSKDELVKLIEEKRESGVFLTCLGVGTGNYNEAMMEQLANNGNGTYEYIDCEEQAQKIFVDEFGKFFTVAKDVKVQIIFDSTIVDQYRLIGYENRLLDSSDFNDDNKDAAEIGSGQTITAIYEIIPKQNILRGNKPFNVDFRYKLPDNDVSKKIIITAVDDFTPYSHASENFRFASSVAAYGLLLGDSKYSGDATYDQVKSWASQAKTFNPFGYKDGFLLLIDKAKAVDN